MINFLKFILSFICYTILVPLFFICTIGLTWYILPAFQTTFIGEWLLTNCTELGILIATITSAVCSIIFYILGKRFTVIKNSKALNFYTHVITWLFAIILFVEAVFTFAVSDSLSTVSFEIDLVRKIGIGSGVVGMLLYSLLAPKVRVIVNRKIQAYDTAKELNANGRSSVIWMNILKTLDFICPELILLSMLCFAVNFDIALYFIFVICSFILPIIGNMICDKRVKKEAIRKKEEENAAQVNATAEAVADLLAQRGNP